MIYVASSWRNEVQQNVVHQLQCAGHTVYDFKNPRPGDNGFSWGEIDPDWQSWSFEEYAQALKHPLARDGFKSDLDALNACDTCVLVLPCGRSAHTELGYMLGQGKKPASFIIHLALISNRN